MKCRRQSIYGFEGLISLSFHIMYLTWYSWVLYRLLAMTKMRESVIYTVFFNRLLCCCKLIHCRLVNNVNKLGIANKPSRHATGTLPKKQLAEHLTWTIARGLSRPCLDSQGSRKNLRPRLVRRPLNSGCMYSAYHVHTVQGLGTPFTGISNAARSRSVRSDRFSTRSGNTDIDTIDRFGMYGLCNLQPCKPKREMGWIRP